MSIGIGITDFLYPGTNIDRIKFDRMGAEGIFRLLLEMGATKDTRMLFSEEDGRITFIKTFAYKNGMMPTDDDNGQRFGEQVYSLREFIKLHVRFDRTQHKRLQNTEAKIRQMHAIIEGAAKQL